jgi:hypothetical protein
MDFAVIVTENIRLIMLRALEQVEGYTLNESILHTVVERFGHKCGRDCIRTQIAWLREQGLVTVEEVAGYFVPTLTQRGADVACGRAVVPGVKKPGPGR